MLARIKNYKAQSQMSLTWIKYYLTILFGILILSGCNNNGGNSTAGSNIISTNKAISSSEVMLDNTESGYPILYNNVVYIVDSSAHAIYMYQASESKFEVLSPNIESVATGDDPTDIIIDPSKHFVYVPNYLSDSIYCYTINQDTGILTFTKSVSIDSPTSLTIDPTGKYAYVTDYENNTVNLFSINAQSGVLEYITNYSTLQDPYTLSIDPHGAYLYVGHFSPGSTEQNNVLRFKIGESGLLDPSNVTSVAAGSYNTILVNSQNNNYLYSGSLYAESSYNANNNISSFAIDESGSLIKLSQIGKSGSLSQMILVDDQFLYASDNYNNKIDMYKVESQSGELAYFPNESYSSIITQYSVSDMALARSLDKQMLFAITNDPVQTFTRYTIGPTGLMRLGEPVLIPNMQAGNHSADAIAVANLIPDQLEVLTKGVINLSGEIVIQAPLDVDINSLKPELYLVESSAPPVAGMVGGGPWILIPEIIEVIVIVATGGSVSVTLKTHAEDFKDGDLFIFKVSANDKNGKPIPPVDGRKLRLIMGEIISPAKKTNAPLNQGHIDVRVNTISLDPLDAVFPPRYDPMMARCDTVSVTQQPKDKSKPSSMVPCADVIVTGKKDEILSYIMPSDFKLDPENIVTVSFNGVSIEDYSSALNKYETIPMKYTGTFTTTKGEPVLIFPYSTTTSQPTNIPIIFKFSAPIKSTSVNSKTFKVTATPIASSVSLLHEQLPSSRQKGVGVQAGGDQVPGAYRVNDPNVDQPPLFLANSVTFEAEAFAIPEASIINVDVNGVTDMNDIPFQPVHATFLTIANGPAQDPYYIYVANHNGEGYSSNFKIYSNTTGLDGMDWVCTCDPHNPMGSGYPMMAAVGSYNTSIDAKNRWAPRSTLWAGNAGLSWALQANKPYKSPGGIPIGTTNAAAIFNMTLDNPIADTGVNLNYSGFYVDLDHGQFIWKINDSAGAASTCGNYETDTTDLQQIVGDPYSDNTYYLLSKTQKKCSDRKGVICAQYGVNQARINCGG